MKGVISVGSNLAQEYEYWLSLGVENFIFFEPVQSTYDKMVSILPKTKNIQCFRLALGNMTGKAMMNTERVHGGKSCSILNPSLHLKQYPDIVFEGKTTVNIDKLDAIKYDRSLYDHLHIDVQGYEKEVLRGAVNSLNFIKTMQVEVYRAELYEGCPLFIEMVEYLWELGYSLEAVTWTGLTWGNASFRKMVKI